MNYIKHLTGFFDKVVKDNLLNPTHISLYIALFQFWNCNRFRNPISISRDEVMRISKIGSLATYHKCLKILHAHGYIKYEPSFNPYKGSYVYLFNFSDDLKPTSKNSRTPLNFESANEQVLNKSETGNSTSTGQAPKQALVPYINNTNISNNQNTTNSLNLNEHAKNSEDGSPDFLNVDAREKEKSSAKKEKEEPPEQALKLEREIPTPELTNQNAQRTANSPQKRFVKKEANNPEAQFRRGTLSPPTAAQVLEYFKSLNYPEIEATKFFNYYESVGWLVGGKTPMVDWPAAARNWMLNAPKIKPHEPAGSTREFNNSGKNYSEPL